MFRSLLCKSGGILRRTTGIINGESSSSTLLAAKYFLFTQQNQNVFVISKSRVTSIFNSFYTTSNNGNSNVTSSDFESDSSHVVSYLISSCGLSQTEAIIASKKIKFKTTTKPDSVLTLLKTYGFTESHISKLITKHPSILLSKPDKTLKPKLDFFRSKGLYEIELANFISTVPGLLMESLNKKIIPSFDKLRSLVQYDESVIKMIPRNSWILRESQVQKVMVNIELLRNQGVPQTNIPNYLIHNPRAFTGEADSFKEIVEKVKGMGFHHLQTTFLKAVVVFTQISEVNWRNKMDVYKRWGWSEDQIQSAFRKNPGCMVTSEKKIMAIMNFLVNEMGYDSSIIAETPVVFNYSLKGRIIPRCSVISILVSRGLIKEKIAISTFTKKADKYFLDNFVIKYEQQVPELMKIFQGQLNYQQLLQN
ncbi:uncharacterized protein LOC113307797 [Papaver somniferum]|uniref:uncharacterized protein LOC113307797 n=1 Tax=Papaver somniferum TaxID=3469 RepID=UPI000E6FBDC8|nr:uncharacterized protein LOC113307797 [Papaver somniferum]XP_026412034.1 uncharacterized protein LOC113307797 [Papaver somniferum]